MFIDLRQIRCRGLSWHEQQQKQPPAAVKPPGCSPEEGRDVEKIIPCMAFHSLGRTADQVIPDHRLKKEKAVIMITRNPPGKQREKEGQSKAEIVTEQEPGPFSAQKDEQDYDSQDGNDRKTFREKGKGSR